MASFRGAVPIHLFIFLLSFSLLRFLRSQSMSLTSCIVYHVPNKVLFDLMGEFEVDRVVRPPLNCIRRFCRKSDVF